MRDEKAKTLLFMEPPHESSHSSIQLLQIWLSPRFTRIDLGCVPGEEFSGDDWVNISPEVRLISDSCEAPLMLDRAERIPLKPQRHVFSSSLDKLYCSLYFEALPLEDQVVHMVEGDGLNDENFRLNNINIRISKGVIAE